MVRIAATPIIADVKNAKALGQGTVKVDPCQPMSEVQLALPDHMTIAVGVNGTCIGPTTVRGMLLYAEVQALLESPMLRCLFHKIICMPCRGVM